MGSQNEATLSTHPARSETKKVTDKEPTRPVRNTRTWMKTTSYGKTKQHLFVGLLLGVIVLSTQAQALSIEQPGPPICCQAYNAKCLSCAEGISEEQFCRKNPRNFLGTPGCEKYTTPPDNNCCQAYNAKCESCKQGISEEEYCKKNPSDFFWRSARLREVPKWRWQQTISLLQGKQRQVPLLRRGLERERLLQEEPIYWRLREVQLLQGKQRQVPLLRRGLERGRVLQEEPIYCRLREVQELLPVSRGQVRVLQAGHKRGRVLQEGPIYFFWTSARLREVQLLQGKQYQVPLLRRGHKRGRVLQEEPIFWRLRAVHLLPGSRGQVRGLQAGHKRGTVLQEEPTKFSGYTRLREVHNTSR